jgi:hypothetical protein
VTADLTYAWRGVPPENRRSGHGHHCCRDRAPTRVIAMRARRLLPIVDPRAHLNRNIRF